MFNVEVDSFYVVLYLQIALLSFVLYLTSFLLMLFTKYKILGFCIVFFVTMITHELKHGKTLFTHYLKDDDFEVVLYTIPSSSIRKQVFLEYYNNLRRMPPINVYYGLEKSQVNTTGLKTERQKGNYAYFVGFKKALEVRFNLSCNEKWILFFEDDAIFVPWFRDSLSSATYWYSDNGYDMIWLDTTNSLGWVFQKKVYSRMSSVFFATNSLEKIASLLDNKEPSNWNTDNPPYYLDMVLSHYCRMKILKCAHMPLSFHRGLKSSID